MANTNTANVTYFADMVMQRKRPKRGFLNFFESRPENVFDSLDVEFDIVKEKRLVAKAKNRNSGATENGTEVFKNVSFIPPNYKESRPYNIANFNKRIAGETIYSDVERRAKLISKTAADIALLDDKISRAELLQATSVFQTGQIKFSTDSLGVGLSDLDFECPTANFANLTGATGSEYWDDADADPIRDIEARMVQIEQESGYVVDNIVMGLSAQRYFARNTKIKDELDNRRVERGVLAFEERRINGFQYWGTYNFNGTNVDLWTYSDWYLDPADNSTTKSYVDTKKVIFIASEGDYQVYHAGVDVITDINDTELAGIVPSGNIRNINDRIATSMYVSTYKGGENKGVMIEVQKNPLYVPRTNDSFGCMQVLA